jgi:chromosomal replication initiation ATPase DnaA
MIKTEKKIEALKKRIRMYANTIGLTDYDLVFIAKNKDRVHQVKTLQGLEQCDFWINRIYDALKINIKAKERNQDVLFYRQATSYILNKRGVKNLAIAKALGQSHTTVSHTIQVTTKWIEISDPTFLPYYLEINNFFNEFENKKLC